MAMTHTTCHVTISLDGFLAGANQTLETPLGVGGEDLHQWMFPADEELHEGDVAAREHLAKPRGAYVMGRNMFVPGRGEWGTWDGEGWWGEEPPYHAPVFVLTHAACRLTLADGGAVPRSTSSPAVSTRRTRGPPRLPATEKC